MRRGPSTLVIACLFVLGALARVAVLTWPGTDDVRDWETESLAAAHDLTAFYGLNGRPAAGFEGVEDQTGPRLTYPPIAVAEFAAAGHLYRAVGETAPHAPLLTALVKLPGLVAELVLAAVLLWWRARRSSGESRVASAALALWLNPVVWLAGCAQGYADAQMAVPAVLAVIAASSGQDVLAGSLVALGVLTKPQALFVVPALLLMVRTRSKPWRRLLRVGFGAGAAGVVVLLPFLIRGAGRNLLQAFASFESHDMLSGNAANVWWIVSWVARTVYHAPLEGWRAALAKPMFIVEISRWTSFGYPSPRIVGWLVVLVVWAWGVRRVPRGLSPAGALVFSAWVVYAYAMFAPQVHENHLYLAVVCLTIAAAWDRRVRVHAISTSVVFGLNLYLFYGLGNGAPPLIDAAWTGIDMTVLLSIASLVVFTRLTRALASGVAASS